MVQLLLEAKRLDPLLLPLAATAAANAAPAAAAANAAAAGAAAGDAAPAVGAAATAALPFAARLLEAVRGVTRGSKDVSMLQTGMALQVARGSGSWLG